MAGCTACVTTSSPIIFRVSGAVAVVNERNPPAPAKLVNHKSTSFHSTSDWACCVCTVHTEKRQHHPTLTTRMRPVARNASTPRAASADSSHKLASYSDQFTNCQCCQFRDACLTHTPDDEEKNPCSVPQPSRIPKNGSSQTHSVLQHVPRFSHDRTQRKTWPRPQFLHRGLAALKPARRVDAWCS